MFLCLYDISQFTRRSAGELGNLPAPGGPMRIIRIESALGCLLPPASSRCSSSHILDSSLCTWSFKVETMSSVMGAIVSERLEEKT